MIALLNHAAKVTVRANESTSAGRPAEMRVCPYYSPLVVFTDEMLPC